MITFEPVTSASESTVPREEDWVEFATTDLGKRNRSDANRKTLLLGAGLIIIWVVPAGAFGGFVTALVMLIAVGSMLAMLHFTKLRSRVDLPLRVAPGHPFHPDGSGPGGVSILIDGAWHMIDGDRIILQPDTLIEGWIVHEQDAELTRLGRWSGATGRGRNEQLATINHAIAYQNTTVGLEDPFADARARETEAEGFLERSWLGTSPGQFDVELGALARAEWEGLRPVPSKATPQEDEPAR